MAENGTENVEEKGAEPAAGQEQTDYKALYEQSLKESRKWEDRSKRNLEELKALKESAGKPDKSVEERLAALEDENAKLKADAARSSLVQSVAKATGLDAAIVSALNGADEEELTAQAEAVAALAKPASAPKAPEAGKKDKPGKPSKADILAIKDPKERKAAIAANIDLF